MHLQPYPTFQATTKNHVETDIEDSDRDSGSGGMIVKRVDLCTGEKFSSRSRNSRPDLKMKRQRIRRSMAADGCIR